MIKNIPVRVFGEVAVSDPRQSRYVTASLPTRSSLRPAQPAPGQ